MSGRSRKHRTRRSKSRPADSRKFTPEAGKDYLHRTAYSGGEKYPELLVDGKWWRLWRDPDNKQGYYLSDPCDPDDPNVVEAPDQ